MEQVEITSEERFDKSSDNWTNRSHDYPKIDQDSQFEYLNNLKKDYIKASKEKQTNVNGVFAQYVADLRAGFDKTVEFKDEVSMLNASTDLHDNNWSTFKQSSIGQSIASILNGDQKAVSRDGNLGYDVDGKFMTPYDLKKIVNENTFDTSSKKVLDGTIEYVKTLANQARDKEFDIDGMFFKIKNEVVKKGKLKSLIYDTHVSTEGGSFYTDLVNRLEGTAYEELGITNDMLKVIDTTSKMVNIKDGIDRTEATIIADELVKDVATVSDYITNYFTMYMKNQFDKLKPSPTFGDRSLANSNEKATLFRKSSE